MIVDLFSWFKKPKEIVEEKVETETIIKPHYVFIHGANQSRVCWNYIIKVLELSDGDYTCIEYTSLEPFDDNLDQMTDTVKEVPDGSCFVGHSLGGIYAMHLYKHFPQKFSQAITISTPFGGSSAADYLKYISPSTRLFKDVGRKSLPITSILDLKLDIPWTQMVTVRGNSPWLRSRNDGIVTERSMTVRDDMEHVEVFANHYEVLVYDPVVETIKNLTFEKKYTIL